MWRGRPGLAYRWHLANGNKQGQDALATEFLFPHDILHSRAVKDLSYSFIGRSDQAGAVPG
jgi:hypothetical protein